MFISPWLLAGAVGLLILIIVIFAANNIQREKELLTDSLFRKGLSLIRFVEAGTRATSMMTEMMGFMRPEPETTLIQRLIEQASDDPDIHYIAVIDTSGKILAHSESSRVGEVIDRNIAVLKETDPKGEYHIVSPPAEEHKTFEVISRFEPLRQRGRPFRGMWMHRMSENPGSFSREKERVILVGLNMTELENAIKQYRYQIVFLSLVLLFVGLGGWVSLLAAQGYRISEQALSRIQAFTGLLISRLPVGIIATDAEGKVKTFNQAASLMTGLKGDGVINRPPSEVLPSLVADFLEISGNNNESEEILEQEISLPRQDGTPFSLHLASAPVYNQEKTFMGRVLLMHDLSELKKLEKEVRRHDRLVALGKMAAGVAHEVRNPLSSIKGFATLLQTKFKENSEEKEVAGLLVNETERLNRSITELLNYARPTPLRHMQVDLAELLKNSLKLVTTDAHALGITLALEISSDLPKIEADPDRLNQVLLNLYLNGLQAMELTAGKEGELKVMASLDQSGRSVNIDVRDTGPGIPRQIIEQVLDPYFTTKPDGTGLGLAIANKIIDEHGGAISFSSQEGEGTTVRLTLPIKGFT